MNEEILTVYVVRNGKGMYYGASSYFMKPLKDARIFSKRNTATAVRNRMKGGCKVIECTLTVPSDSVE